MAKQTVRGRSEEAGRWAKMRSVRLGSPPPGRPATRISSTTALGNSRLWATIGHGIINEIYWPSTGRPEVRDLGFYLLGNRRWVDLKRVSRYGLSKPKPYLPLLTIVHTGDDYRLDVEVLPDPLRDVLLMHYNLEGPYRLGIIAAPHLGGSGYDNTAWVDGNGNLYASVADRGDVHQRRRADERSQRRLCRCLGWLAGPWRATGRFTLRLRQGVKTATSRCRPRLPALAGWSRSASLPTRREPPPSQLSALAQGYATVREEFLGASGSAGVESSICRRRRQTSATRR